MNNILIISIESKKIKTEEIYFVNKKNKGSLSLKRDKEFLKSLNLKDVFFASFNIYANFKKILNTFKCLANIKPKIHECFILCDRDMETFTEKQILNMYEEISKILVKKLHIFKENIHYLKYKREYQNFENFLLCHIENKNEKKFKIKYSKTDKDLYKKTMGKNGKNLKIFKRKLENIDFSNKFKKLFKKRPDVTFE